MPGKINWDGLGITASALCAIHCALLPILFGSLPFLGFDLIKEKSFEYGMIALAFVIGIIAMSHGYRKHHQKMYPIIIFSLGIIALLGKELNHVLEIPLLIFAVGFILTAHIVNYRLCRVK